MSRGAPVRAPRGPQAAVALQRMAALLYPRRCPFCGAVLGADAAEGLVCPDCAPQAAALEHRPPRLPATEHALEAMTGAAGAYYYAGIVRQSILRCKEYGNPWLARELADLLAIRAFGAWAADRPGGQPFYQAVPGFAPYDVIVPVPAGLGHTRRGFNLPGLWARRLGRILHVPAEEKLLLPARRTKPQKTLDGPARFANQRGAYRVAPGAALEGKRVLLVDDILTTGATASACALALMAGGAAGVFAVCIAADEELPAGRADKKPGETEKTTAQNGAPNKPAQRAAEEQGRTGK